MAGSWIHVRKTVCLCRICCKICFGCVLMAIGMCRLVQGRWIQLLFYESLVQSLGMLRKSLPETESKTWKSSSSTESPSLRVTVYGLWILSEIMLSFWRPSLSTIVYSSLCKSGRTCIFQWSFLLLKQIYCNVTYEQTVCSSHFVCTENWEFLVRWFSTHVEMGRYVEPSVRPDDSRYGDNPNRVQCHTQFQVLLFCFFALFLLSFTFA
jgi:hypothetical protein